MSARKSRKVLFDPASTEPFPLSRSKVQAWIDCPRCMYFDRRLGLTQPGPPSMMLNRAVDVLLKAEFDQYRERANAHPIMAKHGIDAVPFRHPDLATWRSNFKGIRLLHRPTNFMLYGAVDDIWVTPSGELLVVDYKGTASAKSEPQNLDAEYRQGYKRQLEFYQFLLRGNGFTVARRAYIVYAVGKIDRPTFDAKVLFDMQLLEHLGNTDWIEPTLLKIKETLMLDSPPPPAPDCELCRYIEAVAKASENRQD
ncbi:MAG: PD-(D/E)XK nuclease family protein [Kiritimatiellia bacterium]